MTATPPASDISCALLPELRETQRDVPRPGTCSTDRAVPGGAAGRGAASSARQLHIGTRIFCDACQAMHPTTVRGQLEFIDQGDCKARRAPAIVSVRRAVRPGFARYPGRPQTSPAMAEAYARVEAKVFG